MDRRRLVIVGGGTAGCVLATRLSDDDRNEVILIEQGGWANTHNAAWDLSGAFDPETSRRWPLASRRRGVTQLLGGRTVGGSGRINGSYFIRPTRRDLEEWAALAGPRFLPDSFTSFMIRAETDLDFGMSPVHGDRGPIIVQRDVNKMHPASSAFRVAANELGFIEHRDVNDGGTHGIGAVPFNMVDGIRSDPSIAYLSAALGRQNLQVVADAEAAELVFFGTDVVGVKAVVAGVVKTFDADEVILSCGAVGTPKLLMISGVGPERTLDQCGVAVKCDQPSVGQGLRNHVSIDIPYLPREFLEPSQGTSGGHSFMQLVLHAAKSEGHSVDAELMATRRPYGRVTGLDVSDRHLSVRVTPTYAAGRGFINLVDGSSPGIIVEHAYADSGERRRCLRDAVRLGVEVMHHREFDRLVAVWEGPGPQEVGSESDLDRWIDSRLSTSFHMLGSCAMGVDPATSVVDSDFRVHGLGRLRIVDASVIPVQLSRGPSAAVVALAELAAEVIAEEV